MLSNIKALALAVYHGIWLVCTVSWARFNRWLCAESARAQVKRVASRFQRSLGVVGDDVAEGLGDYLTFGRVGGPARTISAAAASVATIKQTWHCFNYGHSGSLSTEWLPGWEGPPKAYAPRPLYRKSLWESRIEELRTMDMVAVTLGLSDVVAAVDPEETFANVRAFAEALAAELGPSKFVYLSTVPGGAGELEEERERRHRLNELIVAYVGERSGASAGEDDGSFGGADGPKAGVYPGPRLGRYFDRESAKAFTGWTGRHMTSKGYNQIGRMWVDDIKFDMVKVEWGSFKDALS